MKCWTLIIFLKNNQMPPYSSYPPGCDLYDTVKCYRCNKKSDYYIWTQRTQEYMCKGCNDYFFYRLKKIHLY